MGILDIIFITLGIIVGGFSYVSGKDYLYKLFLGLIIGFLLYALLESQIAIGKSLPFSDLNQYQRYLGNHDTQVLTFALFGVPFLGIFFMMYRRFSIETYEKSPSHLLLGVLLPLFILSILAYLSKTSILRESSLWKKIFDFLEQSFIYEYFQKSPWIIFLLLLFLLSYKTLFVIFYEFAKWCYQDLIPLFFKSWKKSKQKTSHQGGEEENHEGNDGDNTHDSSDSHDEDSHHSHGHH